MVVILNVGIHVPQRVKLVVQLGVGMIAAILVVVVVEQVAQEPVEVCVQLVVVEPVKCLV